MGSPSKGFDTYDRKMETHIQGCEAITTRGIGDIREGNAGKIAEAYLWRFAGRQGRGMGQFPREGYGFCENSPPALPQLFSGFDSY